MDSAQTPKAVTGVPRQAFEQFLIKLAEKDVPNEILGRLKDVLISQGNVSEIAIKAALFPESNTEP